MPSAFMWVLSGGGCGQTYGSISAASARLLASGPTQGLTLTYAGGGGGSGGGGCESSRAELSLLCEPSATTLSNVSLAFLTQGCVVQLQALSAAACPYTKVLVETPLGAGYISFIVLTVALSLYCGVGAGLKRYRSGASGIEAIPHIDLLRRAHAWVRQRMGWGGGIELGDYAAAEDEVPW